MSVRVTSIVLEKLKMLARETAPREACGILLGDGNSITQILPAANMHAQAETHFEIDPQALIGAHRAARNGGPQVLGYYHSHPRGPASPSATDQQMAGRDGRIWAIISGEGDIAFWRDGEQGFTPLSYDLCEE